MDVEERVFDDDERQRAWLEGCRREEAISGLLERHGDKRLSIKDVDEVAWGIGGQSGDAVSADCCVSGEPNRQLG